MMIDLDYDVNNSLVQNYQNIVKNDTVIYCINDADAHCSKPTCDEALDPIRVVTEVCQQSPTASLPIIAVSQSTVSPPSVTQQATRSAHMEPSITPTPSQSGCSLRSPTFSSVHMLVIVTVMLVCLQPLFSCC